MTTNLEVLGPEDVEALARVRAWCRTGKARRLRLDSDATLAEIAAPVGVTPPTIFKWESGLRRPCGAPALRYGELLSRLAQRAGW